MTLHRFIRQGNVVPLLALAFVLAAPGAVFCAENPVPAPAVSSPAGESQGGAAVGVPITLKESITALVQTHDRIKAAEAALQSSEHQVARAKGLWYPRVNAQVDAGREDINRHESDLTTGMYRNVSTLSANQLLYDFGGAGGTIDQAKGQRN